MKHPIGSLELKILDVEYLLSWFCRGSEKGKFFLLTLSFKLE